MSRFPLSHLQPTHMSIQSAILFELLQFFSRVIAARPIFFYTGRNVALKQAATQSSTENANAFWANNTNFRPSADLAVDGNTDQHLLSGKSCSHTAMNSLSIGFWKLILSPPCVVHRYALYNRFGKHFTLMF